MGAINPQRGFAGQRGPAAQNQPVQEISEEQRNEIGEAVRGSIVTRGANGMMETDECVAV
jgi:hypothetical protein